MRKLSFFILMLLISINLGFSQQKMTTAEAVNIAGKQRMLSQRMAKNKVYIKSKKNKQKANEELNKAITEFNKGIVALKKFAPTDIIKHRVQIQEHAFKTYKKQILDDSKESMKEIIESNTLFLAICDEVVTEIIKYAESSSSTNVSKNKEYVLGQIAKATGASGKLRYLTQRLALYFAINKLEIERVSPLAIEKIINTLENNLNYLTILEFNTLDIDDALSEVQYHWTSLKSALYKNQQLDLNTENLNAIQLYEICNTILEKANTATKMYSDLSDS